MSDAYGVDEVNELAKRHSGGGDFLSLKNDGDSAVGCFLGEPYGYETVWTGGNTEVYDPQKHSDYEPKFNVVWNFYVIAEKRVRVVRLTNAAYSKVIEAKEKYGFIQKAFEIKRNGAAGDQKTTYSILFDPTEINNQAWHDIVNLDLHDLKKKIRRGSSSPTPQPQAGSNGQQRQAAPPRASDTIGEADAVRVIDALKNGPSERLDEFMSKFGVDRVRDVPADRAEEALFFVQATPAPSPTPAAAPRDPFS